MNVPPRSAAETSNPNAEVETTLSATPANVSIYKWKAKFGLEVSEAKRLKTLEDENTQLKRFWLMRCWTMLR